MIKPTKKVPPQNWRRNFNGFNWMKGDKLSFPFKTIEQIKLNNQQLNELKSESLVSHDYDGIQLNDGINSSFVNVITSFPTNVSIHNVPEEVAKWYKFSNYLLNPNRHRFQIVVRIMALVIRFIRLLKKPMRQRRSSSTTSNLKHITIPDEEVAEGKNYYFKKATIEIKSSFV